MMKFQDFKRSPGLLVAFAAVILPFTVPLVFLLFPVLALGALYWLASYNASGSNADVEINANAIPRGPASENEQPVCIAAKASTQPTPSSSSSANSHESNGAAAGNAKTIVADTTPNPTSEQPPPPATVAASGPKAVGGAAILAKLKAQKAARAAAEAEAKDAQAQQKGLTILYASQLGTAAEIAKNIHAEAESKGIKSRLAAMNDFGFGNISAENTPMVVMVASSTGDGDAPDNSSKFYNEVKRRSNATDRLAGVSFTCLGLGDSNYTRYMAVPRVFKNRFLELGATTFYDCAEADEVDGLEEIVDAWISKLWSAVAVVIESGTKDRGVNDGTLAEGESSRTGGTQVEAEKQAGDVDEILHTLGVPALPKVRVSLQWADAATAASVRAAEEIGPTSDQLAYRDVSYSGSGIDADSDDFHGLYSPDQPFWAPVTDAKLLTATFPFSTPSSGGTPIKDPIDPDLDRRVLHMEVDISGSGMEQFYKPGDSIGILPENDPRMVDQIITRLGYDPDAVFSVRAPEDNITSAHVNGHTSGAGSNNITIGAEEKLLSHLKWPCTVRHAFLHGCDMTTPPRKSLLRVLAEHCTEITEKQRLMFLCSRQGRDSYATEILAARPSLLELLNGFPSCTPPLDALLDALPALPPRMYSITCSPMTCPNKIQVAFTIVKYTSTKYDDSMTRSSTGNGTAPPAASHITQREGVATTWLDRLCTPLIESSYQKQSTDTSNALRPLRVPIFLRKGGAFKTPSDLSRPWIMIGPGTGVAPFRGFLQERRARIQKESNMSKDGAISTSSTGECWLYFGCRRPDLDYLYESDLKSFQQDGTLTRLEVAFSRAPRQNQDEKKDSKKVYVQHFMAQHRMELYNLFIEQKGTVFVCGDGATMAKDVHATLVNIIATGGKVTEAEAAVQLSALAKEGRYVRDIWS
ncbi:putative Methionine synthase reductase [Nannochloris sp. 'desiccata']|nr:hypothetical protein KSW81_000430 [Chlorella desiccata (nom. nud.)]KAH7620936.1 putative Methionine synthase reductase [Chlorella desiccata (nom. nud.)]